MKVLLVVLMLVVLMLDAGSSAAGGADASSGAAAGGTDAGAGSASSGADAGSASSGADAGGTIKPEYVFNKNFEDYKKFFYPIKGAGGVASSVKLNDDLMIKDTSITVCNMHGDISPDSTKYTGVVPENNILCFVSPINYVLAIKFFKKYNLASEFNNMSYELYKELFIHHGNIRNAGFGDLKTAEKSTNFVKSYACLVDCMCVITQAKFFQI